MFDREPVVEREASLTDAPVDQSVARVQAAPASLIVGPANDPLEREADAVAADVLSRISGNSSGWPDPAVAQTRVRRSAVSNAVGSAGTSEVGFEGGPVSADIATRIRSAAGRGAALDPSTRSQMEPAFGADFSRVRVHAESPLPPRIGASAFTLGPDIHLAAGQFRPNTSDGQRLLAHELTHVLQQGGAGSDVQPSRISRSQVRVDGSSIRRHSVGRVTDAKTHALDTSDAAADLDSARRGPATAAPAEHRMRIAAATGADLSRVRLHDDAASWSLNGQLGTAAFASGRDVFFRRNVLDPSRPLGASVLDHELGHVAEQQLSGRAPHAQALAIDDARITALARREYMKQAATLELNMGPYLSKKAEVIAIADDMLARLKRIVDAWAEATRTKTSKVYESEFSFPTGEKYYGSFKLTAKQIRRVFDRPQPLRKKLNLIYYCVRNGNLNKYLEVAANELMEVAGGGTGDQRSFVPGAGRRPPSQTHVRAGFAAKSGLKGTWDADRAVPAGRKSKDEVFDAVESKRTSAAARGKMPVLGDGMFGGAFGGGSATGNQLRGDKVYGTYAGLDLAETNTLTRGDVDDITTAEMRLLYQRGGKRQPAWISSGDKDKFKRDTNSKILWEQGGENIEIKPESETRRIADLTMSRLEGGISGSTDLMMHASKHLGYSDVADLKRIRLALVAWMLSNRDHSFFEIMKVAADYGVPFALDPANPGDEYETADHFFPLGNPIVGLQALVPGGHMPAYYLSGAYTGQIDAALPSKGKTSPTFVDELRHYGMTLDDAWKQDAKADDLAQWLSLKGAIAGLNLTAGHTEDALRGNRIAVQQLQKDASWHHLLKAAIDPHAKANLRALLSDRFGATAVVSDAHLNAAGLPPSLFEGLEEYKRYDVLRLDQAVQAAAPRMGGATSRAHTKRKAELRSSLPFAAVKAWLGKGQAELVLGTLLEHTLGGVRASGSEARAAATTPRYAAFVQAYPDKAAQHTRLQTFGVPASWLQWVSKTYSRVDPTLVYHYLDELGMAVAGAGLIVGDPASVANVAARNAIRTGRAYQDLVGELRSTGRQYAPLFVTYMIERRMGGAAALTVDEHAQTFEGQSTPEKIDELTALGVPRDIAETTDKKTLQTVHDLHRVVIDAAFTIAQPSNHASNKGAWAAVKSSTPFTKLVALRSYGRLTEPIAAAMVREIHGAGVLRSDAKMLATAIDQRMANADKVRLGKTQVMDTNTLTTPKMSGEAPAANAVETATREQRYWASDDAQTDFDRNVGGTSPTVQAELGAYKIQLRDDDAERARVMTEIATGIVAQHPDPKPTVPEMERQLFDGSSKAEVADAILGGMLTPAQIRQKLNPDTVAAIAAIEALSDRERGALYQYTNKLHDEMGYATQQFSRSSDFTPHDLQQVTTKLRSLRFMLPMIQAMHSALEQLPAYTASDVYSGRKSGNPTGPLTGKTDNERIAFAARNFKVGSIISYSYPLSTAKDVDSSYIVLPGYDVCLQIQQPVRTGRDIEYLSNKPNEKEVLFPQGVRFKVISVQPQPPGPAQRVTNVGKLWVVVQEV